MRRPALALLLGCLLLVAGVSALDGYAYYQTIEYAACDQEIYQQDIVIHRSTGTAYNETTGGLETWHIYVGDHCREDYGDIRFTNSTGELAYYLWPDYDSSSARFAVRLEGADSAGTLTIHYGNAAATTTSDGDAVYIFFDQFEGTALNTSKWTDTGTTGEVTISGGEAVIRAVATGWRYLTSKTSLAASGDISVEINARVNMNGATRVGANVAAGRSTRDSHIHALGYYGASHLRKWDGSRWWYNDAAATASTADADSYTTYRFDLYSSGTRANYWANGVNALNNKPVTFNSFPYIELFISTWDGVNNPRLHVPWVLVRAYSAAPPAATTFSGEQSLAAPPATAFTDYPLCDGLTISAANLTQQSVTLSGTTPYPDVWIVLGAAPGKYGYQSSIITTNTSDYSATIVSFPLIAGQAYYARAGTDSGYSSEVSFSLPALTPAPVTTHGDIFGTLMAGNLSIDDFWTAEADLYARPFGGGDFGAMVFISLLSAIVFVVIFIRSGDVIVPFMVGALVGGLLIPYLLPQFAEIGYACMVAAMIGIGYSLYRRYL